MKRTRESDLVSLSTGFYRVLLNTYPSGFRREYSQPMAQVFQDCCREANRSGGLPALLVLWARTMIDYLSTVIEEYSHRGVDMNRNKFLKLSGWALVIGPVSITLGSLASNRPTYSPYSALSSPIDVYLKSGGSILIVLGLLLVSTGLTGLLIRYGAQAGAFGKISLSAGALAGVISALGAVGLAIVDREPYWSLFFIGMLVMFLGLALFSIPSLQRKLLPRGNLLPLIAIGFPTLVLFSGIYESTTGKWLEVPDILIATLFLLTAAALLPLAQGLNTNPAALQPPETI